MNQQNQNQKQKKPKPDPIERLTTLLGADPGKEKIGQTVVDAALSELKEEQDEALKVKVKEEMGKAIDIRKKQVSLDREFQGKMNKSKKELGKVVSRIESWARGESPNENEDKKEDSESSE